MTQLNLNLPVIGDANATEDPKIRTALSDIQTVVNALDDTNVASNANVNGSKLLNSSVSAGKLVAGILPPAGSLMPYAGSAAPTGYLLCNGQSITSSDYPNLFAVLQAAGYPYGGNANGANIPNLEGRTIVGQDPDDSDFDALGETRGNKTETLTTSQIPSHGHTGTAQSAGSHSHGIYTPWLSSGFTSYTALSSSATNSTFQDFFGSKPTTSIMDSAGSHTHSLTIDNAGGGGSHNNIQPSIVLTYIIKT